MHYEVEITPKLLKIVTRLWFVTEGETQIMEILKGILFYWPYFISTRKISEDLFRSDLKSSKALLPWLLWATVPSLEPEYLDWIIRAYLPRFDLLRRKLLFSRMKIALLQFLKIYDCYIEPLTSS